MRPSAFFFLAALFFLAVSASALGAGWVDVTGTLPHNVQIVAAVPGKDKLVAFAGVQKNGSIATLWSSLDGGASWTPLATGAGSESVTLMPLGALFDPAYPDTFWTWGNYVGTVGGTWRTVDGGNTFHSFNHDNCGLCEDEGLSIDFKNPTRNTMVVGVHETPRSVRRSFDGGKSWVNIGTSLPAGSAKSQYPLVLDSLTYLIGCSFTVSYGVNTAGGAPGVFRTADGGKTWNKVSDQFVFQAPLVVGNSIYWAYYNGTDGGLLKSEDNGVTWKTSTAGGLDYTAVPILLPEGKIATLTASKAVATSPNGEPPWTPITPSTSLANPLGLTYNAIRHAFFIVQKNGGVQRFDLAGTAIVASPRNGIISADEGEWFDLKGIILNGNAAGKGGKENPRSLRSSARFTVRRIGTGTGESVP